MVFAAMRHARLSRRRFLANLALSASAVVSGDRFATSANPTAAAVRAKYRLVRDWSFGRTIKTQDDLQREFFTRYRYENNTLDHFHDEWERYREDQNHVFTSGLELVARVTTGLRPDGIESGMLRSRYHQEFGYFESRFKVPRIRGIWVSFWLNPATGPGTPEIDIVEIVNNGKDTTRRSFHALHGDIGDTLYSVLDRHDGYDPGFDFADSFHQFSVEWTPHTVRHFVDDRLVANRSFPWVRPNGSAAGPAELIINLAVGGTWPGPPQSAANFPAALAIDYIRIYA
jgi:beta-glucanase (GH16 family)